MARDIAQECKDADEIGFSCSIGAYNDVEPGELDIHLRKTLEIFYMDFFYGHTVSVTIIVAFLEKEDSGQKV
jgi:hypothetical protein